MVKKVKQNKNVIVSGRVENWIYERAVEQDINISKFIRDSLRREVSKSKMVLVKKNGKYDFEKVQV